VSPEVPFSPDAATVERWRLRRRFAKIPAAVVGLIAIVAGGVGALWLFGFFALAGTAALSYSRHRDLRRRRQIGNAFVSAGIVSAYGRNHERPEAFFNPGTVVITDEAVIWSPIGIRPVRSLRIPSGSIVSIELIPGWLSTGMTLGLNDRTTLDLTLFNAEALVPSLENVRGPSDEQQTPWWMAGRSPLGRQRLPSWLAIILVALWAAAVFVQLGPLANGTPDHLSPRWLGTISNLGVVPFFFLLPVIVVALVRRSTAALALGPVIATFALIASLADERAHVVHGTAEVATWTAMLLVTGAIARRRSTQIPGLG